MTRKKRVSEFSRRNLLTAPVPPRRTRRRGPPRSAAASARTGRASGFDLAVERPVARFALLGLAPDRADLPARRLPPEVGALAARQPDPGVREVDLGGNHLAALELQRGDGARTAPARLALERGDGRRAQ